MKYTIHGLQQDKLLKNELDNDDALILSVIKSMYSSASVDFEIIEGDRFIWVDQTRLLELIPIVGSSRKLKRRLKRLEDLGIIKKKILYSKLNQRGQVIKGTYSYINVTEKLDDLSKRTEATECHTPPCQNDITPMTECHTPPCQNDITPMTECHTPPCQNDITPMTKCHDKDTLIIDTLVIDSLIEYFNKKEIIKCKKKTKTLEQIIIKKIKEFSKDEIIKAIDNYSSVIHDPSYFFKTKWSLEKFLKQKNALPEFLEDGEKWINYKEHKEKENLKDGNKGNRNSITGQYIKETREEKEESSATRF